jgi:catalase
MRGPRDSRRLRCQRPSETKGGPNSAGGPAADPALWTGEGYEVAGETVRAAYTPHAEDGDFGQPRTLWEKVLTETDRGHLVSNIVAHASAPEVTGPTRKRVAEYWGSVHADLGAHVADGILGEGQ